MNRTGLFVAAVLALIAPARTAAQYAAQNIFPSLVLDAPVGVYHAGDGSNRLFVVGQAGAIRVFPNVPGQTTAATFLDLTDTVTYGGERGLLGLAFHPQYTSNRYFYVNYTADFPLRTVVSRFEASASNPDSADRSSEIILFTVNQPYTNHNGGQLAFGPDGYLYIALGDGGSMGDPQNRAQNTSVLLGKILRINVDSAAGGNQYAIPPSNPFAGSLTGEKEEIFAYGLRNPWRFSFDPLHGTLWAADVGQIAWEEIDTIRNGANLGWNLLEGTHCYSSCDSAGTDLPVHEYEHVGGRCSITGGFVYRGAAIPSIAGAYIYADYCTGEVWAFDRQPAAGPTNRYMLDAGSSISSFGVDEQGEIYICGLMSDRVYKLILTAPPEPVLTSPANAAVDVAASPTLVWLTSAAATSYRLQVSTEPSFAATVCDDSTLTDTSMQIGPLGPSTTYYWRVRGANSAGASAFSAARNFTTAAPPVPPAAPALLSPADGALSEPTALPLVWGAAANAASYHVQASADSTFASPAVDDSLLTDTLEQVSGLEVSTHYFWRVRGRNAYGYGPFSAMRKFTTGEFSSIVVSVRASWNMVSLPVSPPDGRLSVLFPTAISQAFAFDPSSGYHPHDTLVPGEGYWIKFADSQQVALTGTPRQSDTIEVLEGWNMIGTIALPHAVSTILQDPPGILVSPFFGYAAGYEEDTLLQPGKAYWVKANAPGRLILSLGGIMSIIHTGGGTYYTFADGGGNCMFDPTPEDLMVGAMNEIEYANSAICGSCATVTGPNGTINIRIVDRCPECPLGWIDLSPLAFSLIADFELGRAPITWHLRPCDVSGPIAYHFKDGSNQWWTAVQVRNHRNPIAKFEYMVSPGVFKTVTRSQYNYFVEPAGMGPGPFTFRVTDVFGNVLTDGGIIHVENGTLQGAGQFP